MILKILLLAGMFGFYSGQPGRRATQEEKNM